MKRIQRYTNLKILDEQYHFDDDIFETSEFGNEKVIEWINNHQKEFQKTIDDSKKPILVSNLNPNAEPFCPKNLNLLSDVADKQNYLEQIITNNTNPKL